MRTSAQVMPASPSCENVLKGHRQDRALVPWEKKSIQNKAAWRTQLAGVLGNQYGWS